MEEDGTVFGELEDQCTCWVCFEIFAEPVTLHCSHTFCKECALQVHKKNPSCPFCRRAFDLPLPDVNKEVESLVAKYLNSREVKSEKMTEAIEQDALIFHVPDEVLVDLMTFLPPKDVGRMSRVSRDFKRMADDSWIWREFCQKSFPFCSVDRYGKNWKWCYIARSNIHKGWEEGKAGDFQVVSLRGHKNYINAFSLYRNNIVSGSADSNLKIWKVDSEDPINTLVGHTGVVNCVQFNEVKIVSGATDSCVKLWDTKTGLQIKTLSHNGPVNCVQFDDSKIVSGSDDRTVKIWDARDGSCTMTLNGHWNPVTSLQFDNNRVISCGQDNIKVWDLRTGTFNFNLDDNSGSKARCFKMVSGNQVVTGAHDGLVKLWNTSTGHLITSFAGQRHFGQINEIQCDGKTAISACHDGTLKVWDIAGHTLIHTLSEHKQPVNTLQFNGNKVVSGSADNSIKVWDLKKGTRIYTLLGGSLQKRANNPEHPLKQGASHLEIDDSRIVASFNSLIRVYDFEVFKQPQK
jgi:WD40 repeat protein